MQAPPKEPGDMFGPHLRPTHAPGYHRHQNDSVTGDPFNSKPTCMFKKDFEEEYQEFHKGGSQSNFTIPEDGDPWEKCYRGVKDYDDELFKGWKDQVDKILIFASLLAATVTSFVIDSWKNLTQEPDDKTNWILEQLLLEVRNLNTKNATSPEPTPYIFIPSTSDVRLNVFWFMSLSLSLATVLIGIICSQWLREYQRYTRLPPLDGISVRQLRYEGLFAWKVPNIIMSLPVLLQFSLVLFFVGLLDRLWNLNSLVAAFSTVVIGLAFLFVVVTTLVPSFQLHFNNDVRKPLCPYKSPQAWALHRAIARFFRYTNTSPRNKQNSTFYKEKTWLSADRSWYKMKKRLGNPNIHNDTVQALVWIDKQLENSPNMIFSIYRCIKDLSPKESTQVVSQINRSVQYRFDNILVEQQTTSTNNHDKNLLLYLEAKCQIFPQLGQYHLDSVIRLLDTRFKNPSQELDPLPHIPWASYDVARMPEVLVTRFLTCLKELISLEKLNQEYASALWHFLNVTTKRGEATPQQARSRKSACEVILAMEGKLPRYSFPFPGTPGPNHAEMAIKYWISHVIDLFDGWAVDGFQTCYRPALEALDRRIKDLGGPSITLSPQERLIWETIVYPATSSPLLWMPSIGLPEHHT